MVKAVEVGAGVCSDTLCGCVLVRCACVGLVRIRCPRRIVARGQTRLPAPPPPSPDFGTADLRYTPPPPSPFSVVVSTLQTPLSWDGLCVQHFRRRCGRDAEGQKQHLLSRGIPVPLSRPQSPFPSGWGQQSRHFHSKSSDQCVHPEVPSGVSTPPLWQPPAAPPTPTRTSAPLTSVTRPPPPPVPLQWASEWMSDEWGRVGAWVLPEGYGGARRGPTTTPCLVRCRGGDGDGPVAEGWRAVLLRNRAAGGGANVEPRGA